jgi:hypothetical protein
MIRLILESPCRCGERDCKIVGRELVCIGCKGSVGRINGRFYAPSDGTPGVRDADHRCDMFSPGLPTKGGCRGDGHHLCRECVFLEVPR